MADAFDNPDLGRLVLRLTVGVLILLHGIAKIMHPGTVEYIGDMLAGHGIPGVLSYGVYIGEVLAPALLIAGFRCRIGALLVVANMIVAIALMHSGDLFGLTDHGGWRLELQGFYLFGALAIAFLGSGNYAMQPD
jgi:putative oxidoreductase